MSGIGTDGFGSLFRFGEGAGGGGGSIAWSPSGAGTATTWDDVRGILADTRSPMTINLIDTQGTYNITGVTDLKFSTLVAAPGINANVQIADGAQLLNGGVNQLVSGLFNGGMAVTFNSTGSSPNPLFWDSQSDPSRFAPFAFGGGATIQNNGTVPVINVRTNPDGLLVVIAENTAGILTGTGPIIHLEDGAFLFLSWANNGASMSFDPGFVTADNPASNTIGILSVGGFDFDRIATWVGVAGATVINNPLGMEGGSGPSAYRPFGAIGPLVRGTHYWDADLVPPRPIFWNGASFDDALGIGPV